MSELPALLKMLKNEILQIESAAHLVRASFSSGYTSDTLPAPSILVEDTLGLLGSILRHLCTLRYIGQRDNLTPSRSALLAFFLLDQSFLNLTLEASWPEFSRAKQDNAALLKQASSFLRNLPLNQDPPPSHLFSEETYLALVDSLLLQIDLYSDLSSKNPDPSFLEPLCRTLFRTLKIISGLDYQSSLHISIAAGHFLAYPEDDVDPALALAIAERYEECANHLILSTSFPSLFSPLE